MAGREREMKEANHHAAGASRAEREGRGNGADGHDDAGRKTGRFAYDGLARVIHERSRLSILSSLASNPEGLLFNDLKALCHLTDGNLSRQLQLLQESEFVEVWKGFRNNRPQTLVRLTDGGRERFLEYIAVLENVVADAVSASKQSATRPVTDTLPGAHRVAPA
jgi:DNA-binding MarR family transcriptional regulator